jgi:hypothetical protein
MTTSALRPARTSAMQLVLVLLTLVGILLAALPQPTAAAPQTVTFAPPVLPLSAPELVNPGRGLYKWRYEEKVTEPFARRSFDAYERYKWRDLEPSEGRYDFSLIERDMTRAKQEGRQFALRIRTVVSETGTQIPEYLMRQMERGWWRDYNGDGKADTYVPDWNDADYRERFRRFIAALAARYDGDPRLRYVDIGGYGNWGEWHMHRFPYPSPSGAREATWASRKAIVDAHIDAFTRTPLLMLTDDREALRYALARSPRIGWRRDSLGNSHFDSIQRDASTWAVLKDRWQTAPVVVEFFGTFGMSDPRSLQLAHEQVKRYHISLVGNGNTYSWRQLSQAGKDAFVAMAKAAGYRLALRRMTLPATLTPGQSFALETAWTNEGIAPLYNEWQVVVQLRRAQDSRPVWEQALTQDLRTLVPTNGSTPKTFSEQLQLPTSVPAGQYELALLVRDPNRYFPPLALANGNRAADGSYTLGTISVGRGTTTPPSATAPTASPIITPPTTTAPSVPTSTPPIATPLPDRPQITAISGIPNDAVLRGRAEIRAEVAGEGIRSVTFRLRGPRSRDWTERTAPYYFLGNSGRRVNGWDTRSVPDGTYTLTVIACDQRSNCVEAKRSLRVANRGQG